MEMNGKRWLRIIFMLSSISSYLDSFCNAQSVSVYILSHQIQQGALVEERLRREQQRVQRPEPYDERAFEIGVGQADL